MPMQIQNESIITAGNGVAVKQKRVPDYTISGTRALEENKKLESVL